MKNEDFKAKIEIDHGTPLLKVTHNGWQYVGTFIYNPEQEIPQIIKVLQDFLDKK